MAEADRRILAKKQELAYHIGQVWNVHIPQLHHGHDGLIFTCAESSYVSGTDEKMYADCPNLDQCREASQKLTSA